MLTWGCNAIHRDGHLDNIVSIDYGIQQEIYESGYHKWSQCWFADWNPVPAEILSTMFAYYYLNYLVHIYIFKDTVPH